MVSNLLPMSQRVSLAIRRLRRKTPALRYGVRILLHLKCFPNFVHDLLGSLADFDRKCAFRLFHVS